MQLRKTVVVDKPIDVVFRYLADFTTTTEWDPATVRTVRLGGDGGVGTRYRNTSTFLGRETDVAYQVIDVRRNELVRLRGENKTLVALDTIAVRRVPEGTEVTYTADFTFKGAARVIAPLLRPAFTRLADNAETGLRSALHRL